MSDFVVSPLQMKTNCFFSVHHSYDRKKPLCTQQEGNSFLWRIRDKWWSSGSRSSFIKLPQERPFSLTTLLWKHQVALLPCCFGKSFLLELGFSKSIWSMTYCMKQEESHSDSSSVWGSSNIRQDKIKWTHYNLHIAQIGPQSAQST